MATISKAIGGSLDVASVLGAVGQPRARCWRPIASRSTWGRTRVSSGGAARGPAASGAAAGPEPGPGRSRARPRQRRALEERQLYKVDDWARDERVNRQLAESWGIGSAIVVPLLARERALGLLVVTRVATPRWTRGAARGGRGAGRAGVGRDRERPALRGGAPGLRRAEGRAAAAAAEREHGAARHLRLGARPRGAQSPQLDRAAALAAGAAHRAARAAAGAAAGRAGAASSARRSAASTRWSATSCSSRAPSRIQLQPTTWTRSWTRSPGCCGPRRAAPA